MPYKAKMQHYQEDNVNEVKSRVINSINSLNEVAIEVLSNTPFVQPNYLNPNIVQNKYNVEINDESTDLFDELITNNDGYFEYTISIEDNEKSDDISI
jgi:hypothetical protein